ncbi:hypothetical protein GQ600_22353 [Phytophthora cactorum]|nr:hypothetical protein GQ600_22353 [Phytophthora cactorum]
MGGGNGQKSATKRDRNNAKKMKEAKQKNHAESKAKMEATKPASSILTLSISVFIPDEQRTQLNDHFESKHSSKGFTIEQCFPGKV